MFCTHETCDVMCEIMVFIMNADTSHLVVSCAINESRSCLTTLFVHLLRISLYHRIQRLDMSSERYL